MVRELVLGSIFLMMFSQVAYAQEGALAVPNWDELNTEQQQTIQTILRSSKLVPADAQIQSAPAAEETVDEMAGLPDADSPEFLGKAICRVACDAAAAAAGAACTGLSGGTAIAVCLAAAAAGREECRRRC